MADLIGIAKTVGAVAKPVADSGIFGTLSKLHSDSYKGLQPNATNVSQGSNVSTSTSSNVSKYKGTTKTTMSFGDTEKGGPNA